MWDEIDMGRDRHGPRSTWAEVDGPRSTWAEIDLIHIIKGPATRNDIVDDIVDDRSSTMVFNVAKIVSARASSTISLTKSLRVAGYD